MKLMHKFFYFLFVVISVSYSSDTGVVQNLKASFSYEPSDVFVWKTINFTNNSEGITGDTKYLWDFGDYSSVTSKNPSHTCTEIGDGSLYKGLF